MSAAQKGRQPIYEHMHTSNIILKQKKMFCWHIYNSESHLPCIWSSVQQKENPD